MDHDPMSFLSQHTSIMRNTLSTASLAIAIIGFSAFYRKRDHNVSVSATATCGFLFFAFSVVHGTMGAVDFHRYLNYLDRERRDDLPDVYLSQLDKWYKWAYFHYVVVSLVGVLALFFAAYIALDWTTSSW